MEQIATQRTAFHKQLMSALNETKQGVVIITAETRTAAWMVRRMGSDFGGERVIHKFGKETSTDAYITSFSDVDAAVSTSHLVSDGKTRATVLFIGDAPFKLSPLEMGNIAVALKELGIQNIHPRQFGAMVGIPDLTTEQFKALQDGKQPYLIR